MTAACSSKALSLYFSRRGINSAHASVGGPLADLSFPRGRQVSISMFSFSLWSCLFFLAASFLFCVHNAQVLRYCKFALRGNSVCSPQNLHRWHLMRSVIVGGGVVEYQMHGCIDHVMFGGLWANNGYSMRRYNLIIAYI